MSAKWQRTKAWDDRHFPPALWPVKALLRLFSSVWLGIGLLACIMVYAVLASVPIGLLAKIPTMVIIGLTLLATIAVLAVLPAAGVRRLLQRRGTPRATEFAATFGLLLLLGAGAVWLWLMIVWPALRYEARDGHGLMLFASFVERTKSITLRRLPGFEMSELEFYAWWPLRVILLAFVVNMVVATVRRIEFSFKYIGVLSVHTGIVSIALGSAYYSSLKREGDTVLLAGDVDRAGNPTPGPAQDRFFDNTRVALYVGDGRVREQRLLNDVPRYNDYGLDRVDAASGEPTAWSLSKRSGIPDEAKRPLSVEVPPSASRVGIDPALKFRIIGYAHYARSADDWVQDQATGRAPGGASSLGAALTPLRQVYLVDRRADTAAPGDRPVLAYTMLPTIPVRRIADAQIAVEYTMGPKAGMTEQRWRDLIEPLPARTNAALVVDVPGAPGGPFHAVYPVQDGQKIEIGTTGYAIEVQQLLATPPFPIITPGYENAQSSVAIVRITPPAGGAAFDRYVYHRFPEINQDMLEEKNERGMPRRRDADPAIRASFVDAAPLVQVYFDEPAGVDGSGTVRALIRRRGGETTIVNDVSGGGGSVELAPGVSLKLGERWANARSIERPEPVPAAQRDKSLIGTHESSMLGVEVSLDSPAHRSWKKLVWLPFTKYTGIGQDEDRRIELPDGRIIELMFGRFQHRLPGFALQLVDFRMIAYDHRGSPRDYQSILRVTPIDESIVGGRAPRFEGFEHVTKLNEPLTAPFMWSEKRSWFSNAVGRMVSGLSPDQFKFSQAGWDQQGWMQTQSEVDRGQRPRPIASFTILGVGNNPGIHIVAGGAILMGLGIPWAFYVKPWLVRREKRRIQQEIAAGTYRKPERTPGAPSTNGSLNASEARPQSETAGAP